MERKKIEGMENSELMAFVQKARGLFNESTSEDVKQETAWALFHNLRYAESLMKFRNLPLDHEKLGPRFDVSNFRDLVLVETEKDDQEIEEPKNDNPG